jgi:DNA-binding transcriptional regulator YhcF (GntR family)
MLQVDASAPLPVYEQIRVQITRLVATGQLRGGQRLPSIRQLALDLGVAKATVSKAYEQLERDAVVRADRRLGTVVAEVDLDPAVAAAELAEAAQQFAIAAHQVGATETVALAAIRDALRDLKQMR